MELEVSTPRSLSFRFSLLVMTADLKESKLEARDDRSEPPSIALGPIPQPPGDTQTSNSEYRDSYNMPPSSGTLEGKAGNRIALKGLSKDSIRELRNKGEVSCAECRR